MLNAARGNGDVAPGRCNSLASDDGDFITGQTIVVDGGSTVHRGARRAHKDPCCHP